MFPITVKHILHFYHFLPFFKVQCLMASLPRKKTQPKLQNRPANSRIQTSFTLSPGNRLLLANCFGLLDMVPAVLLISLTDILEMPSK